MKKSDAPVASVGTDEAKASVKSNGHSSGRSEIGPAELRAILANLQTMRDGNFSVRLPGAWTGLAEKLRIRSTTSLLQTNKWRRS
jgi:hypothetical protein